MSEPDDEMQFVRDDARRWQDTVDRREQPLAVRRSERRTRRWPIVLAASVCVALVAVGAVVLKSRPYGTSPGDQTKSAATASPPVAGATDPMQPSRAAAAYGYVPLKRLPRLQLDRTAGLHSAPWLLLHATSTALQIVYAAGPCGRATGVYVSETSKQVTVTVLGTLDATDACGASLVLARTTVALSAPLGRRSLRHAVVDRAWGNALSD